MGIVNKTSLLLLSLLFFCISAYANHHGTRCPLDLNEYQSEIIIFLQQQACSKDITASELMSISKNNLSAIEKTILIEKKPHLPAQGLAYSIPLSFATCQVNLHRECCPALQWCYPLGKNKMTLRCGKMGEAIPCEKEFEFCENHPHAKQCLHPNPQLESCLVDPSRKGCKKMIRDSLKKKN